VPLTDNVIGHVRDVGAGYFSLWNWHRIRADRLRNYYERYPEAINGLARQIGYRVRPSWVWTYDAGDDAGLILGLVNDGIAGIPGVLRVSVLDATGRVLSAAAGRGLSAARQGAAGEVSAATRHGLEGLRVKAEIEVKGQRHPVRWACKQSLNADGTLTLRPTPGVD
jgi:hypothetical protein